MWFCFISMITIGYGDYHPATQLGRAIFVIWGLLGVAVLTILLAVVQDAFGSVFQRALAGSTTRLFDRAEHRARKRRHKKGLRRESSASAHHEHAAAVGSSSQGHLGKRRRQVRQSHEVAQTQDGEKQVAAETRLCDSPVSGVQTDFPTSPPGPQLRDESGRNMRFMLRRQELLHRFPSRINTLPSSSHERFFRRAIAPEEVPCEMENTLVSQPQKLAHAALVTYQNSVQVLRLHEQQIMKTMVEVPALKNYYNARQKTNSLTKTSATQTTATTSTAQERENDEQVAIKKLYSGITQTGNQEHEKIARLVVANLDFETSLRKLLAEISGLKSQVEQVFVPSQPIPISDDTPDTRPQPPAASRRRSF